MPFKRTSPQQGNRPETCLSPFWDYPLYHVSVKLAFPRLSCIFKKIHIYSNICQSGIVIMQYVILAPLIYLGAIIIPLYWWL